MRALERPAVDVGKENLVARRDVPLEEDLEDTAHVRAERPPRPRVAALREEPQLRDLLGELVVEAVLEPEDEHLARDEHRRRHREREQAGVRGEHPGARAEA